MATYQIDHACGHSVSIQLVGKVADRERRIEHEESIDCLACRRARELAAATDANAGLPTLEGSPKQVAWAETIRARIIPEMAKAREAWRVKVEAARAEGRDVSKADALAAPLDAGIESVRTTASARWWIDNKDRSGEGIVMDIRQRNLARMS